MYTNGPHTPCRETNSCISSPLISEKKYTVYYYEAQQQGDSHAFFNPLFQAALPPLSMVSNQYKEPIYPLSIRHILIYILQNMFDI